MEHTERTEQGMHKSCPACGGQLRYCIERDTLECRSCGKHHAPSIYQVAGDENQMEVVEYRCPQCGAAVHTTETNMVSYCSYCGSEVLFSERMTHTRRPDQIVRFRIDREMCESIYRKYMGKLVPKEQKLNFQPVYVPFYYYREQFAGKSIVSYIEVTEDEEDVYTTTYEVKAKTDIEVMGELECASGQFEPETAEKLMFSAKDARAFLPGYLCGMYAEAPDLDANLKMGDLSSFAGVEVQRSVAGKLKTDRIIGTVLPKKVKDEAELWLLPVWLLAENQNGRVFYTAINGEDGSIVCDKPIRQKRVWLLAALLAALFFLLLLFMEQIIILRGNVVAGLCSLITAAGFYCINRIRDERRRQETELEEIRSQARSRVITDSNVTEPTRAVALASGMIVALPVVCVSLSILVILLFTWIGQWSFPVVILMGFALAGFIMVVCVDMTMHMYEIRSKELPKFRYRGTLTEWLCFHGINLFSLVPVIFVIHAFQENVNIAVGGLVSDTAWLPAFLCAGSIVSLLLGAPKGKQSPVDTALYTVQITINIVVTLLLLMTGTLKHAAFLIVGMIMLVPVLVALGRLIGEHNRFITRPVPFFDKGGEKK